MTDFESIVANVVEEKKDNSFSKEIYMFWYDRVLFMRRFEEKCGQLYGQQKIRGFCHLYIGQEACAAGAASALRKGDKWITSYRDHVQPIILGTNPDAIMAELFAKSTGCSKGKGGSMHMFDKEVGFVGGHGIVGAQIPLGAGLGFAEGYLNTGNVSICYMGDGAVRQGAFHETLNLAMSWKTPVIFVIENNGYAMGTSVERTSNVVELAKLGEAYDIPSESVDGMSVEDVHNAVARAGARARRGDGPTLLEFKTYRYKGHSMSDPAKYRSKEELAKYKALDPLSQLKDTVLSKGYATEEELKALDKKIKARVMESVKFAEESPMPTKDEVYKDVYQQEDYPFTHD